MNEFCKWTVEDDEYGTWKAECDKDGLQLYQFNVGGPKENGFLYCPYCGRVLEEQDG